MFYFSPLTIDHLFCVFDLRIKISSVNRNRAHVYFILIQLSIIQKTIINYDYVLFAHKNGPKIKCSDGDAIIDVDDISMMRHDNMIY